MTNFAYKARDRYGVLAAGRMEASEARMVARQLAQQGLTPVSIEIDESSGATFQLEKFIASLEKIKTEDLVVFTRQLASTLEAGVPLINSLDAVAEQIRNARFRLVVEEVKRDIEGGSTFSDALDRHRDVFSTLTINMVRAGEKAGILPQVLDRISNLLEKETVTAAKVKSATRYPLIVLCALAVAFAIMMVYVIPRFASFFSALKGQLPLPTRILIGTNAVIVGYWYWLIGAAVVVVYVLRKYLETEQGRYNWDRLMLSLPVFGTLFVKLYLSRFGRMLGAMLNSGIPVLEALTVTAATVENKVIARVIIDIRNDVAQGKSLTEPMKGSKVFPPIAVSMVAIGEKAGTLEKMLDKMADYFDREVDYTIDNLTPLLEPLLIVGLGVILMIFALGIFLPMWEMVNLYKQ